MNNKSEPGVYFASASELAAALSNVRCFHDLSADLIAEQVFNDLSGAVRVDERAAFEGLEADCREIFHWVRGCGAYENGIKEIVRRAKARALNAGSAVPDGWVMVPVEPTRAMRYSVESTRLASAVTRQSTQHEIGEQVYRAMLAAAPTAKKEG